MHSRRLPDYVFGIGDVERVGAERFDHETGNNLSTLIFLQQVLNNMTTRFLVVL